MNLDGESAAWLAKLRACLPDLLPEQRRQAAEILEWGFTTRARQRLAFLTGDDSWQPSVEEALRVMAAGEWLEASDFLARLKGR